MSTILDVDAAQKLMSALLDPAPFEMKKFGESITKREWSWLSLPAMLVGQRLLPLFEKVPAEKQATLLREYEVMVSQYTSEQAFKFLGHDETTMKKKLMFYVAIVKLVLREATEDEVPS